MRNNSTFCVSWIPAKFAKVGDVLKLKNDKDEWVDGWIVEWAGFTEQHLEDPRKAIREHRKRTGDSLPKIKDD